MTDHNIDKIYNENLRQLEISDSVHKETLNPIFSQLINNDAYFNKNFDLIFSSSIAKSLNQMLSGQSTTIVCYGDSMTFGYKVGTGAQVANPYPSILQQKLRENYNNNNITVINEGHSGWQSDEALSNLNSLVLSQDPDLAIVMFGINDTRGSGTGGAIVPLVDYIANMTQIVKTLIDLKIEVILMSPTPINDTNNSYNKKLLVYAQAINEIAVKFNLGFIDLQHEITKLYFNKAEVPIDLFPDNIHFADNKYSLVAEIIMGKLLDYNNFSNILYVGQQNELTVPAVYSPFVDTDATIFSNDGQFFKRNYYMTFGDSTKGTYLNFNFYVDTPGYNLILKAPKNIQGGTINVLDNGNPIGLVDNFANESHVFEAENILIENIPVGFHKLEFLLANLTAGQGTPGQAFIGEFVFRKVNKKVDKLFAVTAGHTLGTLEKFKKVTDGLVRFTNGQAAQKKGVILFENECVELKSGKTLVIEIEGKFYPGSGISWFGNKAKGNLATDNPSEVNTGYLLYLAEAAINEYRLYNFTLNNQNGPHLVNSPLAGLDFNLSHKIRITHTDTGLITVYIDGVQKLQVTNTKAKTGWFGLYGYDVGTVEVTRFEYAYI